MSDIGHIYLIVIRDTYEQYVGQTRKEIDRRVAGHLANKEKSIVDRKMHSHGYDVYELETCPIQRLNDREKYYIGLFTTFVDYKCGGLNITKGGNQMIEFSKEMTAQHSQFMKDVFYKTHKSPMFGKVHSDETRKKISDKVNEHYKIYGVRKGFKASEETKKKLSIAQKKRFENPEERENLARQNRGKHHSDETRKKLSDLQKEYIKEHGVWNKGKSPTKEVQDKITKRLREVYAMKKEKKLQEYLDWEWEQTQKKVET